MNFRWSRSIGAHSQGFAIMTRKPFGPVVLLLAMLISFPLAYGQDDPFPSQPFAPTPVSFLQNVAPVLVQNCIACHNAKKSEGKYVMTTFAQLAKGGAIGAGVNLEPGDADASYFVELCRLDGEPRMPYKLDPLPASSIALIERWVKEGATYDGASPTEEWLIALRKATPPVVPEAYPAAVPITALAFSPDGSRLLVSGYHEVTSWNPGDGTLKNRTRGLAERTHDLAFSPDGKWLATAGGDPGQYGSVRLWSVASDGALALAREFPETIDCVFAVAFSPDSTRLASAGADRAIRVWEVATGRDLMTIEDHADWIFDVAWSPDGKRLATASRDKTCKVFDTEKKESLATFPGHNDVVYCVSFAPDGKSVVSGGNDNQIRVWNPDEDAKQSRNLGGFGGPVFRLLFSPDGKTLAATGADQVVRMFDDYNPKASLTGATDWIYSLAISPDGKTVASGSWDGSVCSWSLPEGKPAGQFVAAPGLATALPARP